MTQVPGHQREGEERRVVHQRGRTPPICGVVPGWIPMVGCQGTTPPIHPAKHVWSSHWIGAEGRGKVNLLQLPVWSPKASLQGRYICHPACGILDLPRRNLGALPSSVHVEEAAQAPTMWDPTSTGGNQAHLVFSEGLPTAEERWSFGRKQETGAHWH